MVLLDTEDSFSYTIRHSMAYLFLLKQLEMVFSSEIIKPTFLIKINEVKINEWDRIFRICVTTGTNNFIVLRLRQLLEIE